eukprot:4045773-Prymnesium_polylepis.1
MAQRAPTDMPPLLTAAVALRSDPVGACACACVCAFACGDRPPQQPPTPARPTAAHGEPSSVPADVSAASSCFFVGAAPCACR